MTKTAESALIAAGTNRVGAKAGWSSPAALDELRNEGLITRDHNLTRKGSIARERLVALAEDKAFG